jgi:hypothetical protein
MPRRVYQGIELFDQFARSDPLENRQAGLIGSDFSSIHGGEAETVYRSRGRARYIVLALIY